MSSSPAPSDRHEDAAAYVPPDCTLVHEHDGYAVYVKPSGKLGISYRGGMVELEPAQWVARYLTSRSLRKQLDRILAPCWRRMVA